MTYVDFSRETGEINQILDVYLPKKIKPLSGFVSTTFNQVLTYSIDLCCDQILNTPFTCQTLFFFFFFLVFFINATDAIIRVNMEEMLKSKHASCRNCRSQRKFNAYDKYATNKCNVRNAT